jgi:hypothetical protein
MAGGHAVLNSNLERMATMCPACVAAAAALAIKAVSAGGVAAYGASKLRSKLKSKPIEATPQPPGDGP